MPPRNVAIRQTPVGNSVGRNAKRLGQLLVASEGIEKVSAHSSLSQIVGSIATPNRHSLCVEGIFSPWQSAGMESDDKNGGPNNLRAWRLHRGMTQEQLAKAVEPQTNTNMIQYLESGERGLSLKWLRRLADALETTPGHLADHAPGEDRALDEMLDAWSNRMNPDQREQLAKIALALTGTDGK